ncbi:hypothetical protein [[Mannheimia] succiniciproducens]|nr:hypothetical protein [[Mannheimia] succiniciproducens]
MMSLPQVYSLDLGRKVNAKEADIAYQKGLIRSQKNFRCPHQLCGIAITCANLERPKQERKVDPYFKSVEYHKPSCPFAEEERRIKLHEADKNSLYENVASGEILVNLTEPAPKKQDSSDISEVEKGSFSRATQSSDSEKEKASINHTKTLSVLVSSFLNNENFQITLPKPYQEKIFLKDAFIKIDGQNLSNLEQNCWRIYYGKAWINKLSNGDYRIVFDNKMKDPDLRKNAVCPSFFIPKDWIDNSPYEKFSKSQMDKLADNKWHREVFIFSDVPSLSHTKEYINFMLEGLPFLEMIYLKK